MRCELGDYFRLKILFCLLSFSYTAISGVDPQFKLLHERKLLKKYSFKEACLKHFNGPAILTSSEGVSRINCMGKIFNPRLLCAGEKMMSSSFTRAVISSDQKSVICEYATSTKINLSCDHVLVKKDCAVSAYQACKTLKKNYAYDLYLIHSAKVKKDDTELIDCHFSNQKF